MIRFRVFLWKHFNELMLAVIVLSLAGSMLMIAANSAATKRIAADTAKTAANTQSIVRSQNDILSAIKQVTEDTQLTAEQQTNIIICMLQVPQPQRTTDTANHCRKEAIDTSDGTAQASANTSSGSSTSSSKSTPNGAASQPNSSQTGGNNNPPPDSEPLKVLGIPVCLPLTSRCVR